MSSAAAYRKLNEEYLTLKNYSKGTITVYLSTLRIFFDYSKAHRDASIDYQEYARRYILKIQSRGVWLVYDQYTIQFVKLFCEKHRV